MEVYKIKSRLIGLLLIYFNVLAPVYAEIPTGVLVEPDGVEIPLLVNIFGQSDSNDVNNVKEMISQTNLILQQANVQFALKGIRTDINDIGDGDAFLTESELNDILNYNLYQFKGHHSLDRGIVLNIADDIWVEKPELAFWHDTFYPVVFLEWGPSPIDMGLTFARSIGTSAGLQPSSDLENLMKLDGTGTYLNESQGLAILALAGQVGYKRSSLAQNYVPQVLEGLRYKSPGALFFSEGWAIKPDLRGDVLANGQAYTNGPDLEAFIAKTGRIDANDLERQLILKYYFSGTVLNSSMDTYIRMSNYDNHKDTNQPQGDPFDIYDVVIGMNFSEFSDPYVGMINLKTVEQQFVILPDAQVTFDYNLDRTKVKVEIPFGSLEPHFPQNIMSCLREGDKLDILTNAYSYLFDGQTFLSLEDKIENIKLAAAPKTIPTIAASFALDESEVGTNPNFYSYAAKPAIIPDSNVNISDYLDLLFSDAIPLLEEGMRESPFINFYDSSDYRGFFTADNNYPDATFPIDILEQPASNPGAGDDDDNFGVEIKAVLHLTPGLHIIGAPGNGNAFLEIGGTEIGSAFSWRPIDINDANTVDPNSWNHSHNYDQTHDSNDVHILTYRDWAFNVESEGDYYLKIRAWFDTGAASLEATEILPDGNRVLLGDTGKGGSSVFGPLNINF